MTVQTKDWDEVRDSITGLALKLKLHFEEAAGDSADQARTAVDAIGESVEAAFDGLKETLSDPALKHDVRDVATGLHDALRNTFAELSAQLSQGRKDPRAD